MAGISALSEAEIVQRVNFPCKTQVARARESLLFRLRTGYIVPGGCMHRIRLKLSDARGVVPHANRSCTSFSSAQRIFMSASAISANGVERNVTSLPRSPTQKLLRA